MEIIYNHGFKDGDIVVDTEFKELFIFNLGQDNFRAQYSEKIRFATEEEKQKLSESGQPMLNLMH